MDNKRMPGALGSNDQLGRLHAKLPGFDEWKAQVDLIADAEGLTPKENPSPGELDVWIKHFNDGKTPAQAWRAVPYW